MNQGQTLPRQLIKWLDSLDLAYSVRNVRRDIANGFIVAEILSRYYPKEITIYSFDNGLKKDKRKDNWEQIAKILQKKEFELTQFTYESIYNQAPDVALDFICKLYEHLTKKKLKLEQRPKAVTQEQEIPSYAKMTANTLAKDRELVRIVDLDEKQKKTVQIINEHNDKLRQEKQDSNIIEYLVMKRRQQLEDQLRQEEENLLERKKKYGNLEQISQPQIKEIQLKSYKSSTSKKSKEQQGQLMEQKGIYENLQENSNTLLTKEEFIDKELTKLGIEKKNIIYEVFNRCEDVSLKLMETLLQNFQENCVDNITEALNNNFIDFKKFFHLFLKALAYLESNSNPFMMIITLYKRVAVELVKQDPQVTQMMFESIVLKDLLQITIKCPGKREQIVELFYHFCSPDSLNRLHLIKKIKEYLTTDLNNFLNVLSILIQQQYDDFDQDLYNIFFFYAFVGLDYPSPRIRTNCLKIISEISLFNYQPVLTKIKKLHKFIDDKWWEVSAQILIICSNLLLFLAQEEGGQLNAKVNQNQNDRHDADQLEDMDQMRNGNEMLGDNFTPQEQYQINKEKQQELIEIVLKLFKSKISQNILRIGLVYLAPVLNYYPELCDRYLEILLEISDKKRETVLMTNPLPGMEEGNIVLGCHSFKYKLTSIPIAWNSVGIAQAMDKYVQQMGLKNFEREHLEILQGCLHNPLQKSDAQTWIRIYEKLKNHVFFALCEKELCALASDILMKIFLFDEIQETVLENSFAIFLRLLKMIYHPDIDVFCKQNLMEFFEFLNNEKESVFKKYTFNIIKKFSEENQNMFLRNNLVEFMNNLAKERREKNNF